MVACEIVHRWRIPEPLRLAWSGGAILLGVSICDGIGVVIPFNTRIALLSGGCMLLLMGLAAEEQRARIPVPKFICSLGDASYSIYLVHYPALSVLCKIAKSLSLDAKMPHQLLFLGLSASRHRHRDDLRPRRRTSPSPMEAAEEAASRRDAAGCKKRDLPPDRSAARRG